MIDLSQQGYSHKEIIKLLSYPTGNREVQYHIDVLRQGVAVAKLEHDQCSYSCDSTASTKHFARINVRDNPLVEWETDLLRPVMTLFADGRAFTFPFVPLLPVTVLDTLRQGVAGKEIEAFDECITLENNSVGEVIFLPRGTLYTVAIESLLARAGITQSNIVPSSKALQTDREDWSEDTDIITIVNQLLEEMGYTSLEVDIDGLLTAKPYQPPTIQTASIHYDAGAFSVILPEYSTENDSYKRPNRFIGVVSNPDAEPMRYEFVNASPSSPISTANTGRVITSYKTYDNIADYDSLVSNVQKWASETTAGYTRFELPTAVMPHHGVRDTLTVSSPGGSGVYSEVGWEISDLKSDGVMTHTLEAISIE